MKVLLTFLACSVAIISACKTDGDCKHGCCIGIGIKFCKDYLKEGDKCTISSKIGCGCGPGFLCAKTGTFTKRCVRDVKDCGKPKIKGVRVIAGKTAVRGSWPWQILLKFQQRPMCGGTLIAPQWVITAAHCVDGREKYPQYFDVIVGEYDRDILEGSEIQIGVKKVFRHPSYNRRTINNDITLLKLHQPVRFTKYVSPACLPTVEPKVGSDCYITGWGKTRHPGTMTRYLQQGKLPVVSNKVCNAKNYHNLGIKVTDAMICGGDGGKSRLSGCHGDSGGPFVCNINGRWEIHGDVSHGPPNCKSSVGYSVFGRVHYFMDWIYETMSTN